jgi:hypothetical protein
MGEQVNGRAALRLMLVAAALVCGAAQARAQDGQAARPSTKWWFGAGAGYISFRSDCENCEHGDTYTAGRGFLVDAGLTLNEQFDTGGEVFTAFSGDDLNHYRVTYALAVAQFRPWKGQGFVLRGGFGLVFLRGLFTVDGQSAEVSSRGLGVNYGAGWIFGRERRVSFAPFGAHYVATLGDVALPSGSAQNAVSNAWMAGVVVLFR